MRYRFELLLGLAMAGALLLGALLYQHLQQQAQELSAPVVLPHGLLFPQPRPLHWPELELYSGEPVTPELFKGRWTLLFFGYTSCPDICPTTLAVLVQLKQQLMAAGVRPPQLLFISVDPGRDTPERLAQYLPWFDPQLLGARGEPAALADLAGQLSQPYLPVAEEASGNYSVDHSGQLMLIDPEGRYIGYLYSAVAVEPLLQSLQPLLRD